MQRNFFYRLFLLCILTIGTMIVHAGSVEYLTLNVNGNPVVIVLAEHPVITYTSNTLHIQTEEKTVDIPVSEVSGAVFSETTGISPVANSQVQMKEGCIFFRQLPPNSQISVYATNGVIVLSVSVDTNGQALVDTSSLPTGVYVVKTAKQTLKVTNK